MHDLKILYRELLFPRLVEERMLLLLRQGRVSKWFSGIGQEAIAVGSALALEPDEFILPLHRNLGVFTVRKVPLRHLIAQFQGKEAGFTKGRDRSFHFGTKEHFIVGMISHLGPQLAVADGIALAHKLREERKATLVFSGEGGTSEGDFHEALNVASVWDLPVIFLIENNGYALSTTTKEQYRCERIVDRAKGYGIEGIRIDGNDFFKVYSTVKEKAEEIRRSPRPVLIECETFRMRGHEEASGTKYVPKELTKEWELKDPIKQFERHLIVEGLTFEELAAIRKELSEYIASEIEEGFSFPSIRPSPSAELRDVYVPAKVSIASPGAPSEMKRYVDAIQEGLREALVKHKELVLMGQDIAEYGGVFKVTEGFVESFGRERIRNTPLCESAIVGAALGLSIKGIKSVVEMQFADFVSCGFNQIVNNLAKAHYRWGQGADVVIRMPTGAGTGAGPFHSQSNEAWFTHVPGLKVLYPATPADAKGLLLAAIEDPNPVMFFEHKALYRSIQGEVPAGYSVVPIGKARKVREGERFAIVTYGAGVHWATKYLDENGISDCYLLDLRTLLPLDFQAILDAVRATGRVMILHEDTLFGGIGGEIAAFLSEHAFEYLDAPIIRCASLDTPVPFAAELEVQFLASARLGESIEKLLSF